jgi:cullin-4
MSSLNNALKKLPSANDIGSNNNNNNAHNNNNNNINKGVRKLVVRNLKAATPLPADFEATSWARLVNAVDAVHASRAVPDSLEQLYGVVEALCSNGFAANTYSRLRATLAAHVGGSLAQRLANVPAGDETLVAVDRAWQAHCDQTHLVRSIFLYLDRTYVLQQQQQHQQQHQDMLDVSNRLLVLWDLALNDFRELVLLRNNGALLAATLDALLAAVGRDRRGADIDRALARRLLRMLATLNLYNEHFEPMLLRATDSFYGDDAAQRAQSLPLAAYLRYAERTLGDEARRVDQYIDERSRRALTAAVERAVLRWPARLDTLVASGVARCVDDAAYGDLACLYRLLTRRGVALQSELKGAWSAYVERTAQTLVVDAAREATLIVDFLTLRDRLDDVLRESFAGDATLSAATRDALERAFNVRATRVAQLTARHSDTLLRSGSKQTAAELETQLTRLVALFRLLLAKDVFEAFYGKHLAKRLLLQRSASDDAERSMLTRLKAECGAQYTSKLEGMIRDQSLSDDIAKSFASDEAASGELARLGAVDLRVAVLTHGFWPQYVAIECALPPAMDSMLAVFKQFYARKHSGRRLHWQHSLSHCALRAAMPRGRKELGASLFQALVLLAFNDVRGTAPLSVAALARHTSLPTAELHRTLESVSTKIRILVRKGDESGAAASSATGATAMAVDASEDSEAPAASTLTITPETEYHVNDRFRSKMVRIKINYAVQARETAAENDKTQRGVVQGRQYQIDAAIVRIMKARKALPQTELLTELFAQLKFPVEAADLKKRIDSLREREYLENDENDATLLKYLA